MLISGHSLFVFCFLFLDCDALKCRTNRDPKGKELKNIYNACMKQQDGNNNSNSRRDNDQDWKETQRYDRRSQDNIARNRGDDNRDYRLGEWDNRNGGSRKENRDRADNQNVMLGQDRNNRDDRMDYRERYGNDGYDTRDGRDNRQNRNENNNFDRNSGVSSRSDFFQNEDFGVYGNIQHTTQSPRRYKRERRVEMNSGKRSQYNPNPYRFSGHEDRYEKEDKSSNENNSTEDEDSKACALHCLLENLHMTGENGIPDRYLVTHEISKSVRDEDLKDFLQESIEECFQILDNENTEDKCEFSKNLLMCLSEKGRSNCDDWKDDFQF